MKMFHFKRDLNKDLLPMKAHFFLFNAGIAPVTPFLSIFARQLGFSSVIVGLIYTALPVSGMIAKPLLGLIADRLKCQKKIFLAAQILTALAFVSIHFSPEVPVSRRVHFLCDPGGSEFDSSNVDTCLLENFKNSSSEFSCQMDCLVDTDTQKSMCKEWSTEFCDFTNDHLKFTALIDKSKSDSRGNSTYFYFSEILTKYTINIKPCSMENRISTYCNVLCNSSVINDAITKPSVTDSDAIQMYQFWVFLCLMITAWVAQAIVVSIGDAICFEMLGDKPHNYGYQRMFGALGWGLVVIFAGLIVDAVSEGKPQKDYSVTFYLAVVFLLMDFLVSTKLKDAQGQINHNICRDIFVLLSSWKIIIFLIWCVMVGMCTALMWNFYLWLIEDLAGQQGCASEKWLKTLEGLAMGIQTLGGELPFFFLSGWILKRIGHVHSMSLVLLAIGVRFILYSVISNPWWFLPIDCTNGLTFGLFYACMASYASIVAPAGTEATAQGLVGAVFEGIGVSLGSLTAGNLFSTYGGPQTFRIFGISALICCLLHAAIQYLLHIKDSSPRYNEPEKAAEILDEQMQELTLVDS